MKGRTMKLRTVYFLYVLCLVKPFLPLHTTVAVFALLHVVHTYAYMPTPTYLRLRLNLHSEVIVNGRYDALDEL